MLSTLPEACVDAIVTEVPPQASPSDMWLECYRLLKPGGHVLVSAEARWALAIRAAGFECRDTIATEQNGGWKPWLLFRKPLGGTIIENALKYHTGVLNIGGARVHGGPGYEAEVLKNMVQFGKVHNATPGWKNVSKFAPDVSGALKGRWPPNVLVVHQRDCVLTVEGSHDVWRCPQTCAVNILNAFVARASRFFPQFRADSETEKNWLHKLVCSTGGVVIDPYCGEVSSTGVASTLVEYQIGMSR